MTSAARMFAAALVATGALQLSAGWVGAVAAAVFVATALAPYGSMLLAARVGIAPVAVVLAWMALVAGAGLLIGAQSSAGGLAALRDGIPRLLTAPRPAPPTPELLLPGALVCVLVGLWVGARSTRPGGGLFAPLVGGAALYLGGALLTAGQADRHGVIAVLLVVVGTATWAVTERRSSRSVQRLAVVGSAVAASVVVAASAAALLLPSGEAFEPRRLVTPPPLPLVERNPLPRLGALAGQDRVLFRHTAGARRLHLVALTAFDGSAWQAGAVYRPPGVVGPDTLPAGGRRSTVTTDVVIEALDGPWLPAPGLPEAVSGVDVRVDADSGSLVLTGGARAGLRYQVRGLVDTPIDADLAVAPVPAVAAYLRVPRLPFLFADFAQRTVQGAGTPFEQAVLIESAVRQGRRIDPSAPAGSSYARLETFLFGRLGQAGAQAGTSEQFATAFAVLARAAGLPTRVVFGFGPGQAQPDGTRVVRGRDALAWPEVYFSGAGWVPFDPSPAPADDTGPSAQAKRQVFERVGPNQQAPQPEPATRPRPAASAPNATPPPDLDPAAPGGPADAFGRVARLAAAVVLAALVMLLFLRHLRRYRHRRAGAEGAWSEVLDLLVLVNRSPAPWHTAVRIARDVAATFPAARPHPALRLAQFADRAAFGPAEPGPDPRAPATRRAGRLASSPTQAAADGLWPEVRRLRRAVRQGTPWYRWLAWPIDPRPVWRR